MTKTNFRLYIPIVAIILLIGLLTTLFFTKPNFENSSVTSSEIKLPDQISKSNENAILEFDKPHQIFINGKKVATTKKYNLKSEDLIEGENTVEVRGQNDYFFVSTTAQETNKKTVLVDRVGPVISIENEIPGFVLLKNDVSLNIQSDSEGKLLIGEDTFDLKSGSNQLSLKLNDGINNLLIQAVDLAGNQSSVIEKTVDAYIKPDREKYLCAGLALPINTATTQRGFSDVEFYGIYYYTGEKITSPTSNQQAYLKKTQEGNCLKPDENTKSYSLEIFPKGTKVSCYPCGGNIYLYYIRLAAQAGEARGNGRERTEIKSNDFTTKSGITGKLTDYRIDELQTIGDLLPAQEVREFSFTANGLNYSISMIKVIPEYKETVIFAENYYKNLESDFTEILNHISFEK